MWLGIGMPHIKRESSLVILYRAMKIGKNALFLSGHNLEEEAVFSPLNMPAFYSLSPPS